MLDTDSRPKIVKFAQHRLTKSFVVGCMFSLVSTIPHTAAYTIEGLHYASSIADDHSSSCSVKTSSVQERSVLEKEYSHRKNIVNMNMYTYKDNIPTATIYVNDITTPLTLKAPDETYDMNTLKLIPFEGDGQWCYDSKSLIVKATPRGNSLNNMKAKFVVQDSDGNTYSGFIVTGTFPDPLPHSE